MTWHGDQLPLEGPGAPRGSVTKSEQLSLLGQPTQVRVPAELWLSWLNNTAIVTRFEVKRHRRLEGQCWLWLGAVSSTGHGSFRAASLPGPSRRGTVPAHLFAYQFVHGVIPRLGWSEADDPCLCHRCDESGCVNPSHLRLGTTAENRAEWARRRRNPTGPLADLRGAAGRARAVAAAIRAGIAAEESTKQIEARICVARDHGKPLTLW
nr:HNH endonuclease [Streptomyces hygroscopicus]